MFGKIGGGGGPNGAFLAVENNELEAGNPIPGLSGVKADLIEPKIGLIFASISRRL
jgi:hypothetical protein